MDRRLLLIGLASSVLAIAGFFCPWVTAHVSDIHPLYDQRVSYDISQTGQEITQGEYTVEKPLSVGSVFVSSQENGFYPYMVLTGGTLSLLMVFSILRDRKRRILIWMLWLGGILMILGTIYGFLEIGTGPFSQGTMTGNVSYGFGLYLEGVGSILAFLGMLHYLAQPPQGSAVNLR